MLRRAGVGAEASLTIERKNSFYTCTVLFTVDPEEPMVRYYPDGSGYPGSPAQVNCINGLLLDEYQVANSEEGWDYFKGRSDWTEFILNSIYKQLVQGDFDQELLDQAEYDDLIAED